MNDFAEWICTSEDTGAVCPVFRRIWSVRKKVTGAELILTVLGTYEARLNGKRISDYVLAPGWTAYEKRLQYQKYDITALLSSENDLRVTVGNGWFRSPMPGVMTEDKKRRMNRPQGIWGRIRLTYADGSEEIISTDASWEWGESGVRFSEIYDGETVDADYVTEGWKNAGILEWPQNILIPQEGEQIRETERVAAKSMIITPAGETLIDFGQEITGYVEFTVDAHAGDRIRLLHGEVLDKNGNFYNENYRSAKAEVNYICREGKQTWHPSLTFFGFRYVKIDQFPQKADLEQFTAIVVCSDIRRTGYLRCSDTAVNQLFSNIFWGQKGNFLDVPTDCPQRDERLGWTGDAQVFVKSAAYNYDVEKFFIKWFHDISAEQREDGGIPVVIPNYLPEEAPSAAWGDAAVICPWQIYLTYGNRQVLRDQYPCMKKWVDYITSSTKKPYLWTGGKHFGDWLGLDAPAGSYKGSSRDDFIASAYYAYSTELLIKTAKILGEDASEYERLYRRIVDAFRKEYPEYLTQTEHVLAVQFRLAEDLQKTADDLAELIRKDGCRIRTGFTGTPYILHVLSDYGHEDLAYTLFLRREYPSWLFPVDHGATTVWEHWDGISENGEFWSPAMNSFNHYAYGAVADWVYEKAAGIRLLEESPAFEKVLIKPVPDRRLEWLEASIDTRNGHIHSKWIYSGEDVRYEIEAEMPAVIEINGRRTEVRPGKYTFWG